MSCEAGCWPWPQDQAMSIGGCDIILNPYRRCLMILIWTFNMSNKHISNHGNIQLCVNRNVQKDTHTSLYMGMQNQRRHSLQYWEQSRFCIERWCLYIQWGLVHSPVIVSAFLNRSDAITSLNNFYLQNVGGFSKIIGQKIQLLVLPSTYRVFLYRRWVGGDLRISIVWLLRYRRIQSGQKAMVSARCP